MSSSTASPERAVTKLFASLQELCGIVSDSNGRYFTNTADQIDYLCFNCVPNLDRWYRDRFVPVLDAYLQANAKCQTKADHYKRFADLYTSSAVDSLLPKALEYLNKVSLVLPINCTHSYTTQAILFTPFSNVDSLCAGFYHRHRLHRHEKNLESAIMDLGHALHFRPQSETCITDILQLLIELNRHSEAYRQLSNWLKSGKCSEEKRMMKLKKTKRALAKYKSEPGDKPFDEESKYHSIKVDSRVKMMRNEDNQRLYFQASGYIPEGEELIVEEPSILVLKRHGLATLCNSCFKPCGNTFLPCAYCTEAIFCSAQCVTAAEHIHRAECGVTKLLQTVINSRASQVYRLLCLSGPEDMLRMNRDVKSFSPDEYMSEVMTRIDLEPSEVNKWFRLAQCDLRHLVQRRLATRSAMELAGAIFILSLYRYKMKLPNFGVDTEEVIELIGVLATDMTKVNLTEFNWHEYIGKERYSIGSIQCLVGSHITHNCDYNADWSFIDGKLVIRSTAAINSGQPIVISYGSIRSRSFFKRQSHVQLFTVMCACSKCTRDVTKNLAFRCDHCISGPVPYHPKLLTSMLCMRCERRWSYTSKVAFLIEQFKSAERLIWLAQALGWDSEKEQQDKLLDEIGRRMDFLAGYIYQSNEQWLRMVADLCEHLFDRKMFREAVDWFQWLLDRFNIFLCCTSDREPMEQLRLLDQWTTTYMAHIVQSSGDAAPLDEKIMEKYINTGMQLFQRTFQVLDIINDRINLDHLVDNKAKLLKEFHRAACDKWNQFKEITGSEVILEETLEPVQFDIDDDLEFEVSAEEPNMAQEQTPIDLSGEGVHQCRAFASSGEVQPN